MNDIEKWLKERRVVYSVLSLFYRGELEKSIYILHKTDFLQQLVEFIDNLELKNNTYKIISEIEENKYNKKYIKRLADEYDRLFVGPAPIEAPLWESAYNLMDGLIFGKTELEIRRLYNKFGLDVKKIEPADHLALELAFMARLSAIIIDTDSGLEKNKILEQQKDFLNEHLLKMVDDWSNRVCANDGTKFWTNIALITKEWIKVDFIQLGKVLQA